jgi:putative hydrolase of the HAD superfamily
VPAFRAALIDLYDTLVEGDWASLRATVAERLGLDQRVVEQAYAITRPARNDGAFSDEEGDIAAMVEATGLQPDPGLVRDLTSIAFDFQEDRVRLHPESLGVVRALRGRDIKTALVSNCDHLTKHTVDRLGLAREMDAIILSFELGVRKPRPAIYLQALEAIDADRRDAVFVDDQTEFCDGAARLGIDTRLIVRPGSPPPEGWSPVTNGHRVITDLRALLED